MNIGITLKWQQPTNKQTQINQHTAKSIKTNIDRNKREINAKNSIINNSLVE